MNIVVLDGDPAAGSSLAPPNARGELDFLSLSDLGKVSVYENTPAEFIVERARDAEIVLTNKVPLSAESLAKLPGLRFISVLATGTNVIDVPAAKARAVVVSNVPGYSTASTAQLTIALLLELCHHVGEHSQGVHAGVWSEASRFSYWQHPLVELDGKTLGIFGFGAIGARVAAIARALGMRVIAHTRTAKTVEGVTFVSPEALFAEADVISLHCPLTEATSHLINDESLARVRAGAFLLNVARGPIVDSLAVRRALESGHLGGYAADVLEVEPPAPDHPLLGAPRCLLTPHIAWATDAARTRLLAETRANVEAFQRGTPRNVVCP